MNYLKSCVIILLASVIFWACDKTAEQTPVQIQRLENELFAVKSKEELAALFKKYPYLQSYFIDSVSATPDAVLIEQLYNNLSNAELQAFKKETQNYFGDMADISQQLAEAFANIKKNYPDFKAPRVVTTITGFMGRDLYFTDSLIVIGLDYFGGTKAKFRPNDLYDYQLVRYDKPYIVPNILLVISEKYNKTDVSDNTLLADMIWYGKGFEFVKHVSPNTPDSTIIAYSEQQLVDVYASQRGIWSYFLDRKLLYEKRDLEKNRFLGERPITVEVSQECPGAIGRWVGWRLVAKYLKENPKTTLVELMNNTNVQQILADSHYKGEPDPE